MRHFAYCPINTSHADAVANVMPHLKVGHVVLFEYGRIRVVPFRDTRADSYGYDLYLYQIDASQNETYLSCGGFN